MSVAQAQRDIDSQEFAEWIALNATDPFSINRTEGMLSILAALIANQNRKKGSKPYQPEDFVPNYSTKKRESDSDLYVKFRALFHGNN